MDDDKVKETMANIRNVGRVRGIDKALGDYDIDVILAPADSEVGMFASAAGKSSQLTCESCY